MIEFLKKIFSLIFLFLLIGFFSHKKIWVQASSLNFPQIQKYDSSFFETKKQVIFKVLSRYQSPLKEETESFVRVCFKYQIDCYLLPAITGVESTFGKFILPFSYNPFGWQNGEKYFSSFKEAIEIVALEIKNYYITKNNAIFLYQMGKIYAPANSSWPKKVEFFLKEFYNEELNLKKLPQEKKYASN